MNKGAVFAVVAVVALVGGGVLFVSDDVPSEVADSAADGTTAATTVEATTGGPTEGDDTSDGNADETTERPTASPGYDFSIESVEKCGTTCRDVTARLKNSGGETRRNVRVMTKMYADDDLLWSGNETVGSLAPGESHVSTERVKVGLGGGMAIRANDGYVTIVTIIESEDGTTRFSDRRKVA